MGRKSKKIKVQDKKPVVNEPQAEKVENHAYGLDAGAWSPSRSFNTFPVVQRREVTSYRRHRIISRARSLYYNSPEVRSAVKTLGMLVGNLKPLPCSKDEEWNKLAQAAFIRRTSNAGSFEMTGSLNFNQLQSYVEEAAIVDGDCLVVFTTGRDGGGVAVYPADMIDTSRTEADVRDGVELDANGKPLYYYIKSRDKEIKIKASNAILYRHSPDPTDQRGLTDLIAAITTAQDLYELNSYNKQSVKLSASFGIVETVDNNVKRTDVSDLNMLRNGGTMGGQSCGCGCQEAPQSPLYVNGVNALTLSPGHDLKTIADTRPSNEVRNFARDLVDSIAHSVGLDPEILYRVKEMGSAAVRLCIAKAKDWCRPRVYDKENLCNRIWKHIIACEISAGRLRACRDIDSMFDVRWIQNSKWSIDLKNDASTAINLIREGLMSRDEFCLENYGATYTDVVESNAKSVSEALEICKKFGIPLGLIEPGQVGQQTSREDFEESPDQSQPNDKE